MSKIFIILIVAITFSCAPGYIVTTNLKNRAAFENNGQVYMLPKTQLAIQINFTKTDFTPGPYHMYAKKYLGIEGARAISASHYLIEDIQFSSSSLPDSDHQYSVRNVNYGSLSELLSPFVQKGLILQDSLTAEQRNFFGTPFEKESIDFTDLSVRPFYLTESDMKDKSRLALTEAATTNSKSGQGTVKSLEEKAVEAAQFIIKLRKRRFKLISGQYEVFPEGASLAVSAAELDKLEKEYLTLFIGKEETTSLTRTYRLIPSDEENFQRFVLTKFSPESGFHPVSGNMGDDLVVQLTGMETIQTLTQLQLPEGTENTNLFFYRIPEMAQVKIFFGSHEIADAQLPVFQLGALIPYYVAPKK